VRDLGGFSAERLAAEDPRLTAGQAARIMASLRATGGAAPAGLDRADTARGRPSPQEDRSQAELDLHTLMHRILVQVVDTVPGAVGAAIRLTDGLGVSVGPDGAQPSVEVPFAIETKLEGALGVVIDDPARIGDEVRRHLEAIASFAATSLAAARSITDTVGAVLGNHDAGSASSKLVASVLGPTLERHVRLALAAERVRDVLDHLTTVFQPVVDLHERRVVGVEALTRFPPQPPMTVDEWFRAAADAGMSPDLEVAALYTAFDTAGELRSDRFLAVNVSPSVAETPAFLEAVAHNFDPARLVIEITEHAPVDDYRQLAGALRPLRNAGARLAIDDAGAGFASLRHVLRLSPDFIKLDLSLVHHIDADPVRRALATSLITFAGEVGATIVAEGIETRFELETLIALGVRYGQGFHLGRPGALP
jgi:EAL domain-containing protein (putative c-di-GMP-specific phosphodiesterase class I)